MNSTGQSDQAIQAFQQAIALDPGVAEPYVGLGVALNRRGRWGDSIAALRQALELGLRRPDVFVELANSLMRCGRYDEADGLLDQALATQPDLAEAWQVRGEILGHRQKYPEAVLVFAQAAKLAPSYARPHHGAGVVLALQGDFPAAMAAMERALKLDANYPEANCGLGALLLRAGRAQEAIAYYEKAVEVRPGYLEARADLALAYEKAGRLKDASAQYAMLARVTTDQAAFEFQRASLGDGQVPAAAPADLVARLFDHYAKFFDEHLIKFLGYRAPQLIFQAVGRSGPVAPGQGQAPAILDLGCGTGLCGQLFKPMAGTLVGVDLSAAMIEKARERGIYDRLVVAELVEAIAAMPEHFDLVTASDVFCYFGDLGPVFQKVASVLRPGGIFAFTVEVVDTGQYILRQTRRYAHSAAYMGQLANDHSYEVVSMDRTALRSEEHREVEGLVVLLRHA